MKGKGCKIKGDNFERRVAKILDAWSGTKEFSRAWLSRGQDERTDDLRCPEWFPFIVSCKKVEGWHLEELFGNGGMIRTWWEEISVKGYDGAVDAMLIFSRNRQPAMVMYLCGAQPMVPRRICVDECLRVARLDEWLESNPAIQWKGK